MNEQALKMILLSIVFYSPVLIMFVIRNVDLERDGIPIRFTTQALLIVVLGYGLEASACCLALEHSSDPICFLFLFAMAADPVVFSLLVFRSKADPR
ncbi:MAG: hypothetical protein KIS92_11625 [Planctomycetota bacterium]|nr:hypothetical protein [Planctomycetota bacterium]